MKTINWKKAIDLIMDSNGKFFTVIFIKRTTGELRKMNARLGVEKYKSGGELPYDPFEKGLIPCFDLEKQGYRMISCENLVELKINGEHYKIIY